MKKFYNNLFLILLSLLCVSNASAQITVGKVYNFRNVQYGKSMTASGAEKTIVSDTDLSDKAQLWYVGAVGSGTYTLRNLSNGLYLQSNGSGTRWEFVDDAASAKLYMLTVNGNMTFSRSGNNYGRDKMHYGEGNGCVVGWEIDAQATQWTATEVSMEPAELNAAWADAEALQNAKNNSGVYQGHLNNLFTDNSCTALKKNFANEAAVETDADYRALPAALQSMVKKVYNGDWYEANAKSGKYGWDTKYAKKFRVQMYEPYSVAGEITSFLNIANHANNDNPTGIYVHERGLLYVMVEGEIKSGATLRIVDGGSNDRIGNATTGGAELKTGLNVIPCYSEGGHLYICYNVETYNKNDKTFPNKLSDFEPLKIHIEGGSINGFYNACGDFRAENDSEDLWKAATGASVDCDEDWKYYEERANLSVVPILGHRQIMLFQLEDTYDSDGAYQKGMKSLLPDQLKVPSTPNSRTGKWSDYGMGIDPSTHKINIMMETWDRIMYSELASMGLLSEEAINKMNDLYPRWKADGTRGEIYSYGAEYRNLCKGRDYSEYFNHHGVALGTTSGYMYGGGDHCGYNINTFGDIVLKIANEAGPTWGPAHEIGHQHQHVFNLNGQTEVTNNFFANVAVWYMGMGTSRYNGNEGSLESVLAAFNTEGHDAYTNNIWALTHIYYRLWLYYHLAGNNTQFWPRLFELCRQEPLVNGAQISGETSLLRFYRHACDAAGEDLTEFFRAHGYLEVMDNRLVGDYSNGVYDVTQEQIDAAVNAVKAKGYRENLSIIFINDGTSQTTLRHDGTNRRSLWEGYETADIGSVNDFISGKVVTAPYTVSFANDGAVTMSEGIGAVGFLVLDENGKILSFSNKSRFTLSKEAKNGLASGKAKFVAVGSDGNTMDAVVNLDAMQRELLEVLVADVEAMPIDDGTYRHVGFYTQASASSLLEALAEAKAVLDGRGGYIQAYNMLYAEYEAFLNSKDVAFVTFDSSLTYIITNYAYQNQTMTLNGSNVVKSLVNHGQSESRWKFVPAGAAGEYYIQNTSNDYYLPAVAKSDPLEAVQDLSAAARYTLRGTGVAGVWVIGVTPHEEFAYLHSADSGDGDRLVGWSTDSDATKWYLTSVENNSEGFAALNDALNALASRTEELVETVATSYYNMEEIALSTDPSDDYYIFCSNPHVGGDDGKGGVAALLDNDPSTYLHSNWSSVSATNDYLQVNLGKGNELHQLQITGVQRGTAQSDFPQSIEVKGSVDGNSWETVTVVDGLPQKAGASWESETITIDNSYPYLRFVVTTGDDRIFFHMAEFSIFASRMSMEMLEEYSAINVSLVLDAVNVLNNPPADMESATIAEIEDYMAQMQVAYEALYAAYESVVDAKKTELQDVIDATDELVKLVGNVTVTDEPVQLTSSNFYSNATIAEGKLEDLLDKDNSSYIHTQWEGTSADNDYHYLRVDMGAEATVGEFYFTYTTASRVLHDMPETIVVEGTNEIDGDNSTKDTFTEIATLTAAKDALPQLAETNSVYTSLRLGSADKPYRYLRFKVTGIARGNDPYAGKTTDDGGRPFFTMAEFGVTIADYVTVTVADSCIGTDITEEMILEAYNAVADAEKVLVEASSIEVLDLQIQKLLSIKEAMEIASGLNIDKSELTALVQTAEALFNEVAELVDGEVAIRGDYLSPNLPVSLAAAVYEELQEAKEVLATKVTEEECYNAIAELQAAYEALASAAALKNIPVLLSADINNPAVYKIGIKRGETKVLEFDMAATRMVAVGDYSEGNMLQGWYFTKGTAGDQVFIHPYLGLGDVLASNDVTDGPAKVKAMPKDSEGYMQEWILATVSDGVYNIMPAEGATYFSNYGGDSNKMGFYSSYNTTDIGSLFTFERVEFEDCVWKNVLRVYLETQCVAEYVTSGSEVGCFVNGEDYNAARAAAVELLADTTATAEDYENGYNTLRAANESLDMVYPEEGKFYTLYNPELGTYVYAGGDNRIYHAPDMLGNSAAVWQFERNDDGTFKLFNMHNGQYVKELGWSVASYLGDKANCLISIEPQYYENYVFVKGGGNEMHAKDNGELVRYNTHTVGKSSWVIKELEGDITYTLSVEECGWSTLVLGFNAVIPEAEDFKAYTVERVDEFVYLAEVNGVLGANTPVIVNAFGGEYAFSYTTEEATVQPAADLLAGTLYDRCVAGEAYLLSDADGEIGFRKVIMDKDAAGAAGTTHFLNNANKAYLVLPEASGISYYGIRFGNEGDEETGIENVPERSAVGKVYDLTGRRVNDAVLKGVYIIDGKKVVK